MLDKREEAKKTEKLSSNKVLARSPTEPLGETADVKRSPIREIC